MVERLEPKLFTFNIFHCRICLSNRPGSARRPLEPIVVSNVFERVQMDLIDMRLEKDDIYE